MFNPLVSIIIPVYNGANYLREAIDSALAQTYRNIEIIVVNDGSTDNGATENIAKSYGDKIRYFCKPNGGVASALNLGIQEMQGEYFSWLSHDDIYWPDKIARQVAYLSRMADKNVLLFCDYQVIDEKGKNIYVVRHGANFDPGRQLYAVFKHMINGCTTLIAKQCLINAGLFNNLPSTQDYDMWFRLGRTIAFHHLPEIVLYSRQHADQGYLKPASRKEADSFFVRIMAELTDNEILKMEKSRQIFFAKVGRDLSNIIMPDAYKFAWQQAGFKHCFLHSLSPRVHVRNVAYRLGGLEYMQALKRFCLGKSNLHNFKNDLLKIRRRKTIN